MRTSHVLRFAALSLALMASQESVADAPVNSVGMELVQIPAGKFTMGAAPELTSRDWFDSRPAHSVTISKSFQITRREVTLEQYKLFNPAFVGSADTAPYASGMSWNDAAAYAKWLSAREGKNYRLPTEAEWEYVARLVARDPTSTPVENFNSGPTEWCLDWFGPYRAESGVDPIGYATGQMKAVRGGRMTRNPNRDWSDREVDFSRPEARLAFPPNFAAYGDSPQSGGFHRIGFRLVLAEQPASVGLEATPPFHRIGVRQDLSTAALGPDPAKPYFRKRYYLPTPPDDTDPAITDAAGFDARFRPHHHSPGVTVMPNGDVLLTIYTSYDEYEAGVSIVAARLRHGADQWDFPSLFVDVVGVNDHAPLLMRDGDKVRFFWGSPFVGGEESGPHAFPFQWLESTDSGASWGAVHYPRLKNQPGGYTRQPINTAFRDRNGRLLLSSDGGRDPASGLGGGNEALLWASDDDGATWYDTGGRTFGRHTVFLEANDGRLLAFGGKNTDIDGFMPLGTSRDGGKSYVKSKTAFPALGSNQRPSGLRLRSGRLLFFGDYARKNDGSRPIPDTSGIYVAVSDNDGASWRFKSLPGGGLHQDPEAAQRMRGATLGYSAAAQGPDGVIHVITTMTRPSIHLSFNEAWLDAPDSTSPRSEDELLASDVSSIQQVRTFKETYANGRLRGTWSGGIADTGAFVLDGPQRWLYESGATQWEVSYALGKKIGRERLFDPQGNVVAEWQHDANGISRWTQLWPGGAKRSESSWRGMLAQGAAARWDARGRPISLMQFDAGRAIAIER